MANPPEENDLPKKDHASGQHASSDVSAHGHFSSDVNVASDAHGSHGDDATDMPTLVPTTWRQLVLPAAILLVVGILVAGPVFNAFATRPATRSGAHSNVTPVGGSPASGAEQATEPVLSPTASAVPSPSTPGAGPTATPATNGFDPGIVATRTAVAVAGENGTVGRIPVELELGGTTFVVKAGNTLLPDWKPSPDVGIATWIEGTFANHILYLPFSEQNAALFSNSKPGATIKLLMNTGQQFEFVIVQSQRAANGPPTAPGQFTVATAMAQDHAGVTIFLVGDPAADRAVVQADFTGRIQ